MSKHTEATLPSLPTFSRHNARPVPPGPVLDAIRHFAGKGQGDTPFNMTGAKFEGGFVLLRSAPIEPFRLFAKVGAHWYLLLTVQAGDPAVVAMIEDGTLVAYGPSPAEQRKDMEREEAHRQRLEAEQRQRTARAAAIREAREQAEARRAALNP
ncbi:MAG: hypothetical protein Kow0032_28780 [Methyloligellaceae bacterium]